MLAGNLCKNDMIGYLRNKRGVLLTICFAVFLALVVFVSIKADGGTTPKYKYFKSIEIQPGDTLWSIAKEYMSDDYASTDDYIREVKYMNSIESNQITIGKYLVVPYYSYQKH